MAKAITAGLGVGLVPWGGKSSGRFREYIDYCRTEEVQETLKPYITQGPGYRWYDAETDLVVDRRGIDRPWIPGIDEIISMLEVVTGYGWLMLIPRWIMWMGQHEKNASLAGGSMQESLLRLLVDFKNGRVDRDLRFYKDKPLLEAPNEKSK